MDGLRWLIVITRDERDIDKLIHVPNPGSPEKSTQDRHRTASGAVRGGHAPEKVSSIRRVSPAPAAGEPNRWAVEVQEQREFHNYDPGFFY
jgi:hypothetical protein